MERSLRIAVPLLNSVTCDDLPREGGDGGGGEWFVGQCTYLHRDPQSARDTEHRGPPEEDPPAGDFGQEEEDPPPPPPPRGPHPGPVHGPSSSGTQPGHGHGPGAWHASRSSAERRRSMRRRRASACVRLTARRCPPWDLFRVMLRRPGTTGRLRSPRRQEGWPWRR